MLGEGKIFAKSGLRAFGQKQLSAVLLIAFEVTAFSAACARRKFSLAF